MRAKLQRRCHLTKKVYVFRKRKLPHRTTQGLVLMKSTKSQGDPGWSHKAGHMCLSPHVEPGNLAKTCVFPVRSAQRRFVGPPASYFGSHLSRRAGYASEERLHVLGGREQRELPVLPVWLRNSAGICTTLTRPVKLLGYIYILYYAISCSDTQTQTKRVSLFKAAKPCYHIILPYPFCSCVD